MNRILGIVSILLASSCSGSGDRHDHCGAGRYDVPIQIRFVKGTDTLFYNNTTIRLNRYDAPPTRVILDSFEKLKSKGYIQDPFGEFQVFMTISCEECEKAKSGNSMIGCFKK